MKNQEKTKIHPLANHKLIHKNIDTVSNVGIALDSKLFLTLLRMKQCQTVGKQITRQSPSQLYWQTTALLLVGCMFDSKLEV